MCSGILSSSPAVIMLSRSPAPLPFLTGRSPGTAQAHTWGQRQHILNSARLGTATAPVTHAVCPTWDNARSPGFSGRLNLVLKTGPREEEVGDVIDGICIFAQSRAHTPGKVLSVISGRAQRVQHKLSEKYVGLSHPVFLSGTKQPL